MKKIVIALFLILILNSSINAEELRIPFNYLSDLKAEKVEVVKFGDLNCSEWAGKFIVFVSNEKYYKIMFKLEDKFALIQMNDDSYPIYIWLGMISNEVFKVTIGNEFEKIREKYPMPCDYFDSKEKN